MELLFIRNISVSRLADKYKFVLNRKI